MISQLSFGFSFKKMNNVDKDIFEDIVRYEPILRWWYIQFNIQQARCLRDHYCFKDVIAKWFLKTNVKNISSLNLTTVLIFSTTLYKSAHFT